ncbi:MAG: ABC transporter substrate-binding protein [Gammaproteobacteria bacterium]|nr:ABC transporter substrate-binding protein [Gammaproteobacteria bacterium]MDH3447124.1 ABC transporter substrate-binding protein [Gammaproteobacteria bacterium]
MKILCGIKLTVLSAAIVFGSAQAAERTLYLAGYGGSTETLLKEKVLPRWEEANNAKVVYIPGNSTTTLAKLQAQRDNQEIDVAFIDDGPMEQALALGFCDKIDNKGAVTEVYDNAKFGDGRAVGFGFIATGLTYNKKMFADKGWAAPTSWRDLEDSKYKGMVVVPPITNGYGLLTLVAHARLNGGGEDNIDPGFDAMIERIGPNVLTYEPSSGKLSELFQSGEVALAVWGSSRAKALADTGFPAGFAYPKEGAVALMAAVCPVVNSDVPDLAQSFIQYLVSAEVQAQLAEVTGFGPVNKNTKLSPELAANVPFGPDKVSKMMSVDYSIINKQREQWTKRWNREVE